MWGMGWRDHRFSEWDRWEYEDIFEKENLIYESGGEVAPSDQKKLVLRKKRKTKSKAQKKARKLSRKA